MKITRVVLGLLHTNCYIMYDEETNEAVVIDPASNIKKILDAIDKLSLKIKYIVLTHAHSDHICALDELVDITGAKICIGKADATSLNDGELNLCNYFRHPSPTHLPDVILDDGDVLTCGNFELKVITTPGHTCGSICLLSDNVLISGDTLFFESVGRSDFATSNTIELMNSIKNKLYTLNRSIVVYPGHGEQTTIGHEIDNNPFVW